MNWRDAARVFVWTSPLLVGAVIFARLALASDRPLPTQRTPSRAPAVVSTPKVTVSTSGRVVTLTVDPGDAPAPAENPPDDGGQVIGEVATATEIMRTKCY